MCEKNLKPRTKCKDRKKKLFTPAGHGMASFRQRFKFILHFRHRILSLSDDSFSDSSLFSSSYETFK